MTFEEYQTEVMRTANRVAEAYSIPDEILSSLKEQSLLKNWDQMIWSLGLTGEAGEFADLMKKHHGHGHDLDREKALKELGDVLWYVSALASSLDSNLAEIAQLNVDKLRKRFKSGFTIEESKAGKLG